MDIHIRQVTPADAEACARIIYNAFTDIAAKHNFPADFPNFEAAAGLLNAFINHPKLFGVVAEMDGKIVGSNFLDERDAIKGVGPITVDPACQCKGVGRKLMEAVIERGRGAMGIRLLQEAYNRTSMALYTSLGFDTKEPIVIVVGKLAGEMSAGAQVVPMRQEHLDDCAELCNSVHGFDRINELRDAIAHLRPFVLLKNGKLTAYCSAANFYLLNHGVAQSEQDMKDLLLGAANAMKEPVGILLPTRQSSLFRWCLSQRMQILKPLTLMSMGEYQQPRGCFFPSISY
jgi:predicted N-acetyltransferase YhbS